MADHFSALKRVRQTETKTTRNRANKSRLRSALRSLREAIAKGEKEAAQTAYRETVSVVDKGVQKGILHKNTASRYKSRLSKRVKAVGAAKYLNFSQDQRRARSPPLFSCRRLLPRITLHPILRELLCRVRAQSRILHSESARPVPA